MRTVITLILLGISICSFGQLSKFSIEAAFSPLYYQLKEPDEFKLNFNHSEGIIGGYKRNDKLKLRTGILYYTRNYRTQPYFNPNLFPLYEKQSNNYFSYLNIPLLMNWSFFHKERFNIYLSTGLMYGVLIRGQKTIIYSDGSKQTISFRDLKEPRKNGIHNPDETYECIDGIDIFNGQVSLGLQYNINKNWSFLIEPYYRSIISLSDVYSFYCGLDDGRVSYGVFLGLMYNFSKTE